MPQSPTSSPGYSEKIYQGMMDAYGPKGGLGPGRFTVSFDDFDKALKTNSDYSNKIYKGMQEAYGSNGSYRPGMFTADAYTFKKGLGVAPKLPFYFGNSDQLIVPPGQTEQTPKANQVSPKPSAAPTANDALSDDIGGVTDFFRYLGDQAVEGVTNAAAGVVNVSEALQRINPEFVLARKVMGKITGHENTLSEDQNKVLEAQEKVNKALTSKDREALANHYDQTIAGQIVGGLVEMAPELATAGVTGGTSFFVSAYNSNLKDAKARNMSEAGAQVHAVVGGAIAQAMMAIPVFHALDNKIVSKFAGKYAGRLLADAIEKNGGKALSTAAVNDVLATAKSSIKSQAAVAGAKILKGGAEGMMYGLLGYGADVANKKLANTIEGKQVFVNDDFDVKDLINGALISGAQIALIGGGSAMLTSSTGRYIRDNLSKNASPEAIQSIKENVAKSPQFSKLGEAEQGMVMKNIDELGVIANQFPSDMPLEQRQNVITMQARRNAMQRSVDAMEVQNQNASDAIKGDNERSINSAKDMVSFMDDRIREAYLNKKYTYHSEDTFVDKGDEGVTVEKKFYKTMDGENPKEITESQYDLASSPQAWKEFEGTPEKTQESEEVSDEDALNAFGSQPEANIGETINTNENGKESKIGQPNDRESETARGETNAPSGEGQISEESQRQVQDDVTSSTGREGVSVQAPSLSLDETSLNSHIGELDDRIQRQQAANYEHVQSGNEKAAQRGAESINADIAKRDFAEKYKMKLDDVIDRMKKDKNLKVDCRGKRYSVRK